MLKEKLKNIVRPIWSKTPWWLHKKIRLLEEKNNELDFLFKNRYLEKVQGVVHVGANIGQERFYYRLLGLKVLWIEPIPETFKKLCENISEIHNQEAINNLVTDSNNKSYDFHITDNEGLSSSLFELKLHKKMWPNVKKSKTISLKSKTLETLFDENSIDIDNYQALVIDTQGSELLVLKGCKALIKKFKYIKSEAADFEAYENCCTLSDIVNFLKRNEFEEVNRYATGENDKIGQYYDLLFKRKD